MFISKRNHRVSEKISSYLKIVGEAMNCFCEGMSYYFEHGRDEHFERLVIEIHQKESEADNICADVEVEMYEKSLLPESREDILILLERLEMLPNQAEDILRMLKIQQIDLPKFTFANLQELIKLSNDAYDLVVRGVNDALGKALETQEVVRLLDNIESLGDSLEQKLISDIFASDLLLAEKMHYRDMIIAIASLCDHAEEIGKFLTIFTVKRRV